MSEKPDAVMPRRLEQDVIFQRCYYWHCSFLGFDYGLKASGASGFSVMDHKNGKSFYKWKWRIYVRKI